MLVILVHITNPVNVLDITSFFSYAQAKLKYWINEPKNQNRILSTENVSNKT